MAVGPLNERAHNGDPAPHLSSNQTILYFNLKTIVTIPKQLTKPHFYIACIIVKTTSQQSSPGDICDGVEYVEYIECYHRRMLFNDF